MRSLKEYMISLSGNLSSRLSLSKQDHISDHRQRIASIKMIRMHCKPSSLTLSQSDILNINSLPLWLLSPSLILIGVGP